MASAVIYSPSASSKSSSASSGPGASSSSNSSSSSSSNIIYAPSAHKVSETKQSDSVSYGPPTADYNADLKDNSSPILYSKNSGRKYSDDDDYDYGYSQAYTNATYNQRLKELQNYDMNLYNSALSWSERMSSTAIQRQLQDLKKAGINPILAGRYGGASYTMPNIPYFTNVNLGDVSSAISADASMYASDISKYIGELNSATSIANTDKTLSSNEKIQAAHDFNNLTIAQAKNALDFTIAELQANMSHMNNQEKIEAEKLIAQYNRESQEKIADINRYVDMKIAELQYSGANGRNTANAFVDIFNGMLKAAPGIITSGIALSKFIS